MYINDVEPLMQKFRPFNMYYLIDMLEEHGSLQMCFSGERGHRGMYECSRAGSFLLQWIQAVENSTAPSALCLGQPHSRRMRAHGRGMMMVKLLTINLSVWWMTETDWAPREDTLAGWWCGVVCPPKLFSQKSDSPIRCVCVCGWCDLFVSLPRARISFV